MIQRHRSWFCSSTAIKQFHNRKRAVCTTRLLLPSMCWRRVHRSIQPQLKRLIKHIICTLYMNTYIRCSLLDHKFRMHSLFSCSPFSIHLINKSIYYDFYGAGSTHSILYIREYRIPVYNWSCGRPSSINGHLQIHRMGLILSPLYKCKPLNRFPWSFVGLNINPRPISVWKHFFYK